MLTMITYVLAMAYCDWDDSKGYDESSYRSYFFTGIRVKARNIIMLIKLLPVLKAGNSLFNSAKNNMVSSFSDFHLLLRAAAYIGPTASFAPAGDKGS